MSKIDYQALRKAAQLATQGEWVAFISSGTGTYAVHTPGDKRCEDVIKWTGFDGQKNAENNARYIAAFNPEVVQALLDELENKVIPVSAELPPANESVLLFDANGEGWLIGWRSLWYTWGQKETGEWQWTFQVGDLENVNITHWAVMPKAPEAGA
ncbi:TPA: ead/Ea22-like family protein [Escherichia coli]|nr:ead/Ea22-like family protein [Escherichia coli]HDW0778723.1 ead/Ea22-like family protein [Escherichia coli]